MNYYMPYFNMNPNVVTPMVSKGISKGLFSKLLGGLNWSSILSNTQKTLGIVNQAIPMIKQISPVMKNAKTMFKVMNEFKRVDSPNQGNKTENIIQETNISTTNEPKLVNNITYDGGPVFFIN